MKRKNSFFISFELNGKKQDDEIEYEKEKERERKKESM